MLVRLVGMMLIVFIYQKHRTYERDVGSEFVGTGLMEKMAIRYTVFFFFGELIFIYFLLKRTAWRFDSACTIRRFASSILTWQLT